MSVVILRDPDEASRFLRQSLWLQRAVPPVAGNVRHILEWALQVAASDQPLLPPLGVIADLGHAALGVERDHRSPLAPAIPGLPPSLLRTYEDHFLGKVYSDRLFERSADAIRRFQGRDRSRGVAYLIRQIRDRSELSGVELPPGIIRAELETPPDELLRRGWKSLVDAPMPVVIHLYATIVAAARRMGDLLGKEDAEALEKRTALFGAAQYFAHRQVAQIAHRLEAGLPKHQVRPAMERRDVATRIADEDTYPVGGFSSISTRGSVESLLHSQLAYMESAPELRPDLFDIKYLRDELYYYSRDENQFLRRRRTFLFCLNADLVKTRREPAQPLVWILALFHTVVSKLTEWLSADALKFEFLFAGDMDPRPLAEEKALLEVLLHEQIQNDTVLIEDLTTSIQARVELASRRGLCHALTVSAASQPANEVVPTIAKFVVGGPRPVLCIGPSDPIELPGDEAIDVWTAALERLLSAWV
ncbi:MAG TPA: hypothetical protein VHR66_28375 [Gemmataceae bacterium]|jgi:hypothetical protein|nr:hypothetical protein [Gemmataceae bacterium]